MDLLATKHDELNDFMGFYSKTASTIATSHWVSHGTVCIFCAHGIEDGGALRETERTAVTARPPPQLVLLLLLPQACPRHLGAQKLLRIAAPVLATQMQRCTCVDSRNLCTSSWNLRVGRFLFTFPSHKHV